MVSVGQERMDSLNGENTAYEEICEGKDEVELGQVSINARAYCGWFGIKSGLQQSRGLGRGAVGSTGGDCQGAINIGTYVARVLTVVV